MRERRFRMGPGAASLILIIVVLSMSVLGALSLSAARQDARLSVRAANVAEDTAALNAAAEASLFRLDTALSEGAPLPEGMTREGDIVTWTETGAEDRTLLCEVYIENERTAGWRTHRFVITAGVDIEDIW